MSEITKPILLDETGQVINETLDGIRDALVKVNHAFIDDNTTAPDRVWSSQKITDALTIEETTVGSVIVIDPIAATPIKVESTVTEEVEATITQTNGDKTLYYTTVIPAAGTYNWNTGELTLTSGAVAQLNSHSIMALDGTNTFSINSGSMSMVFHTIGTSTGGGSEVSWDVIFGGTAAEEV